MPRSFLRRCYRTDTSRFSAALRDPCSALTPINGSSRTSRCASGMTVPPKGHSAQPAASSNLTVSHNSSSWKLLTAIQTLSPFPLLPSQAIISQQDSHIELQRTSLLTAERDRPGSRNRGTDVLLEQEKQRNLEKHREELANFQRLQSQHRQEQARWEREREKQRRQAEADQQRLKEREEECRRLEVRLAEERQELERQRQTYQQDLERLRESTRSVEKERERLEQQRKLKKHNTVPNTAALYAQEVGQVRCHLTLVSILTIRLHKILGSLGWPHKLKLLNYLKFI
ncbi:Rho guanine nucleotide exchange factor 18 [Anabarilius grahami]|uniref:Rho guanine nucleotide exchange factor 18 n=1 Tax=Anabarilius grahami TaxID=495550 RepID=A0A3N0ZAK3_ANAGA|nr:Rho guanine nucleotide exchange factor 18 [Anabarilius grahami]